MIDEKGLEFVAMTIIANAGDARSYAFQALQKARAKDFDKADELIKKSDESAKLAHQAQTDVMVREANGEKLDLNVLFVHSQDHLMTSMLAVELIKELIMIYRDK